MTHEHARPAGQRHNFVTATWLTSWRRGSARWCFMWKSSKNFLPELRKGLRALKSSSAQVGEGSWKEKTRAKSSGDARCRPRSSFTTASCNGPASVKSVRRGVRSTRYSLPFCCSSCCRATSQLQSSIARSWWASTAVALTCTSDPAAARSPGGSTGTPRFAMIDCTTVHGLACLLNGSGSNTPVRFSCLSFVLGTRLPVAQYTTTEL